MQKLFSWTLAVIAIAAFSELSVAEIVPIGPFPYLSAADSPLLADPTLDVVLEDFEDGLLNAPGITNEEIPGFTILEPVLPTDGLGEVQSPSLETDSVDGDDGVIDGDGTSGHSFRSTDFFGFVTDPPIFRASLEFSFSENGLGELPLEFGFVWTDGEPNSTVTLFITEHGKVNSEEIVFDVMLGGDNTQGQTSEDTFFGVRSNEGIERVRISSDYVGPDTGYDPSFLSYYEMDHLQIGYMRIPEPTVVQILLITVGIFSIVRIRF